MRGNRKTRTGMVESNKMDKTVTVSIVSMTKHHLYKKYIRKRVRYKAHDEGNKCHMGDIVTIQESRPISKEKRWKVVKILKQNI